ncbi:MAG: glycoside hydrolase [Acidobacteria bacterium]|nr:glycoside hydrolase [Acidobacteriota bacterium]
MNTDSKSENMTHSEARYSRREFLLLAAAAPLVSGQADTVTGPSKMASFSLLALNYRKLLERADLSYDRPAARSEEGIPVGNGRMGSLVWTVPHALKFQINRVDVYGNDSYTNSFFERHSDYAGGCGFVDIEFGDLGEDVFPATGISQRLSVYDGLLEMNGKGVTARVLAWPAKDVMAVEINDRRKTPEPVKINLRMLRYASQYFGQELETFAANHSVAVQTRSHRATSQLLIRGDKIILTQEFREGDYFNRSAVAIVVTGRNARPKFASETELRLTARPGLGPMVVLIASAASFDPKVDVVAAALDQLEMAVQRGWRELAKETSNWWHDFWARGFVHLHSDDGVADYVEQNYNYFLYLMGASSRGNFPPKFNGMIWNTGGDLRTWGGQHWFANLSCYYEALPATNRLELLDPVFAMYFGMYEASAVAARQQWGSKGIFVPETVFFNGLAKLPEEVAKEMQELYLLRKPWEERSARFREFALTRHPHSSRWNWNERGNWIEGRWVWTERGAGPYGPVTHILGTTAKVAYLFWRRYEYTQDREWLRSRAYPMLKGAAEFYRHYPNLKKGADGKYHIHHVNSNESVWGAQDTDEDLSALRGLLPAAIRAAEILNEDADLQSAWREFLDNLAPLPTSDHPEALKRNDYKGPSVFVRGLRPAIRAGAAFLPDANSLPMWFFDLCFLESQDKKMLETAAATFSTYFRDRITEATPVSVLSKLAIAASALGRADAVRFLIPNQIRVLRRERETAYLGGGVLANRMTLREGPQALDAQRLGRAAEALHLALLQSAPSNPGGDPVIRVFPSWPTEWNASYTLLARGAFLVTSSIDRGRIGFVELESQAGAECRLRNPWGESEVILYRDGKKSENLEGSLLRFPTRKGERVVVVVSGDTPQAHRRALP